MPLTHVYLYLQKKKFKKKILSVRFSPDSRFAALLYSHAVTSQSDFWWKSKGTDNHNRKLRLYTFAGQK